MKASIIFTVLVCLTASAASLSSISPDAELQQTNDKIMWKKAGEFIAGTPASRRRAAHKLGFDRGRWIVAYFSAYCLDCDKTAVKLNDLVDQERVLGLTIAPAEAAEKWKQELGIKYPILSVSERMFEDLGAVILPTVVLFEDGEAKGAYAPSMGEKK